MLENTQTILKANSFLGNQESTEGSATFAEPKATINAVVSWARQSTGLPIRIPKSGDFRLGLANVLIIRVLILRYIDFAVGDVVRTWHQQRPR